MAAEEGARARPGVIALVGSGEYTPAMDDTDRQLLDSLGGASVVRVALLPTASGLEPGSPARWNEMGRRHFERLGVAEVCATQIIDAASAADPAQLALLRDADLYYFSGGDPEYLIETMRGSPAWEIISAAHQLGAVLAGCSAGAMALGDRSLSIRRARQDEQAVWLEALGVVPRIIVFPHFDRMTHYMGEERFRALLAMVPPGYVAAGIDEDTALVRLPTDDDHISRWRVTGRQTVTIVRGGELPHVLRVGDEVTI
jgi:cyanophycinase